MQFKKSNNPEPENNDQVVVFTRLWTESQNKVYAVLLAMIQNREEARDALQDVSVLLWEKFANFEPGTSFAAWACQIARYHALNWRRKHHRRCELQLSEQAFDLLAEQATNMIDEYEPRVQALRICLKETPERYRELLKARYVVETPVHEIAAHRSVSVQAIYKTLNKAHAALLACIKLRLEPTTKA